MRIRFLSRVLLLIGICACWFVTGCTEPDDTAPATAPEAPSVSAAPAYDASSWRKLIPASCSSFFDGCNTCKRAPGAAGAACTRKACMQYQEPHCLDEEHAAVKPKAPAVRQVQYLCQGGERFTVFFGNYQADDQRVKLEPNEVMLSDTQTHTTYKLTRERTASGAKYSDGQMSYWNKANEASVQQDGDTLYQVCVEQ